MSTNSDLDSQRAEESHQDSLLAPRLSLAYLFSKRLLDISVALIGLTLLFVILPVIAALIFLEDRGPLFYRQIRVGMYGSSFHIYKLRSMRVDADDYLRDHPLLLAEWHQGGKLYNDPRVTRVGMFLRCFQLDELPQMWNVLRGEMSLVGPRAIQFSEIAAFGESFPLRQLAKPGLTGLWQISKRSFHSYEQRYTLDRTYVLQRSFSLDMLILFKTILVVFHGAGAY
jgi:lipopolysaccharide/colanic/teichoic acid biosynthesis glycosyltransferase